MNNSNKNSYSSSNNRPRFGNNKPKFGQRFGGKFNNKQSFGGNGGNSSGRGFSRGRGGFRRKAIDVSKFINKVVITEKVEVFTPEHNFNDFKIDQRLKNNIADRKFVFPTPIQDRIIPQILMGKDVVGMANTGTGKTAAFLIPLINKVILNHDEKILIIVPTRELAQQIQDELRAFVKGMPIYSVSCVGGMSIHAQISDLRRMHNFVIGTPGRLKDLIDRRIIDLKSFKSVVLDEADRMLDMGFIHDMKYVMNSMPKEKHCLFFSATLSIEIERLMKEILKDPLVISVKTQEISKNIEQDVVKVPRERKLDELVKLLGQKEFNKVLVFLQTKHGAEKISKALLDKGFKAGSIHGNKTQANRQKTLTSFKNHQIQVLVATDVAARGLDINDISHVINYDIPESHEDYVHRIGRTGRGDKKGKALTFID
jgi:superfamily II DNA/RNA helicase